MRSMFFFTVIGIKITHPIFIMRNKTNKYTYKYVNLLYYKQLILLHVSATYCGLLQGGVLWRMYYVERPTFYVMYPFGFLTPEDGTDRLFRNVGKKLPPIYCVITQKSAVLICFAVEVWNLA